MARASKEVKMNYSWVLGKDPNGEDVLVCYKSSEYNQIAPDLWEALKISSFHDAELVKATKQINAILKNVRKRNKDRKRNLSFILFENHMFMVWAQYGVIGPNDNRNKIVKALGLK